MKRQSGFTLGELMVSLAVAGITLSVGVPGFSDFIANQTQTNATNDLVTAMTLARSEAIKQNRYVSVCKSNNGSDCATGDNWNGGWIVFANTAQANAGVVDAGELVIRSFQPSDTDRAVTASVADLNFVAFRPTGTVTVSATWTICDDRGDYHARAVFVDRAGRARSVVPTGSPVCN
ncbi:MAG: GspH/FimT family pseudopilin [Gammaproteobacteria bacterium]|nr:GspH/FimT family pseudopilin [Gammaproteobacteria bacterium]NNF66095.1 prepilin-type N-terminal cleavage/methylation domain-containing protein [Gammaproteobacteria bacterium]